MGSRNSLTSLAEKILSEYQITDNSKFKVVKYNNRCNLAFLLTRITCHFSEVFFIHKVSRINVEIIKSGSHILLLFLGIRTTLSFIAALAIFIM